MPETQEGIKTKGLEEIIEKMVNKAVDTLFLGMEGMQKGLANRIEDGREEMKAMDGNGVSIEKI